MGSTNPLDPRSPRPDRIIDKGKGTHALGSSDSSDSGSDVSYPEVLPDTDSDRNETGERASVDPLAEEDDNADIDVDRVENEPGKED